MKKTETAISILNGKLKVENQLVYDSLPDILSGRISEDNGISGSLYQLEGHCLINSKNKIRTNIFINRNGDLIIESPDATSYSLVEGDLIYDNGIS